MAVIELLSVIGSILLTFNLYAKLPWLTQTGVTILYLNFTGQLLFHVLTCGERYLAVVHPITYLRLKNKKGIQIRNTTIGCFWLMCIMWGVVMPIEYKSYFNFSILLFTSLVLILISIFNLSILCVLIHPGPQRAGGRRQQCDPSKFRVLFTTMAILGVLLVRVLWSICSIVLLEFDLIQQFQMCSFFISTMWINIPSSLVLPLLFLQKTLKRAGLK